MNITSTLFGSTQVDPEVSKQATRTNPILWRYANAFRIAFIDPDHLATTIQAIMDEHGYTHILSFSLECEPISHKGHEVRSGIVDLGSFSPGIMCITFALGEERSSHDSAA